MEQLVNTYPSIKAIMRHLKWNFTSIFNECIMAKYAYKPIYLRKKPLFIN